MDKKYFSYENLSYPELDKMDREKTIFLLPISLLEEHGPHLPFGVDLFVAEYMVDLLIAALNKKHPDYTIIKLPSLPLGSGGIRWLGTINSKQRTVRKVVTDYCSNLGEHGFKYVLISNGHGGLGHVVALEEAARKCSRKYNMSVISPSGKVAYNFLTGRYIPEIEEKSGIKFSQEEKDQLVTDSHAGWFETSVMMLINPGLVKDSFRELKPFVLTRRQRMLNKIYPGDQGYRGFPAKSTKEYAKVVTEIMISHTMDLVKDWLDGKDMKKEASSPLYGILFFRTNFDRSIILSLIAIIILILYLFLQ